MRRRRIDAGLLDGDTWSETPDDLQPGGVPRRRPVGPRTPVGQTDRHPTVAPLQLRTREALRCNADDRVRHAADDCRPAKDADVSAERSPPVAFIEHHDVLAVRRTILARAKEASDDRSDA